MKRERKIVIWPFFFDSSKSRKEGRRVPRSICVENPTVEEVAEAARKCGYEVEIDGEAKHPAHWFESKGRIFVYSEDKKTVIVKRVATKLKELRRGRDRKHSS